MIDIVTKAAENLCTHQLGLPCTVTDTTAGMRTVIASIDIGVTGTATHRVYISYGKAMLKTISEILLGEGVDDDETLTDMALETANLIVGSAKVLAAEQELTFLIGTPVLEATDISHEDLEATRLIHIDDQEMMIGIKGL